MALYTWRSGADNHPEDTVLQPFTDMVRKGGVLNVAGGDFAVTQRGAGANMSVDIAAGRIYLKKAGNVYPVRNSGVVNLAIANNNAGNPLIASIVVYLDLSADPSVANDGSGLVTITKVLGAASASPVAPTDSEIATAIGSSNPYEVIANITVPNGTPDIENGDIADARRRAFFVTPRPIYTLPYSATVTPDYENGSMQQIPSMTGNITVNTPTNMQIGDVLIIEFFQDGTGNRTATFNFTKRASGGEAPQLDGTASSSTIIVIRKVGASTYHLSYGDVGVTTI
jgi:hypothetical protein